MGQNRQALVRYSYQEPIILLLHGGILIRVDYLAGTLYSVWEMSEKKPVCAAF